MKYDAPPAAFFPSLAGSGKIAALPSLLPTPTVKIRKRFKEQKNRTWPHLPNLLSSEEVSQRNH